MPRKKEEVGGQQTCVTSSQLLGLSKEVFPTYESRLVWGHEMSEMS